MDQLFALSLLFTFGAGILAQRAAITIARKSGAIDTPSGRKQHHASTPKLGGLGVLAAWLAGLGLLAVMMHLRRNQGPAVISPWILAGVAGMFMLGIIDDFKNLGPYVKLAVEFILAGAVLFLDPSLRQQMEAMAGGAFGWFAWPLVLVWVIGITNAFNFIDGLDGLAATTAIVIILSLLALGAISGISAPSFKYALPLLASSILAFLYFNRHPARVFLGDNGSLMIGFMLALCSVKLVNPLVVDSSTAAIIIVFAYPIMDMGLAVWRRLLSRQPIFKADRAHLHHRLPRLGLTVPQTLWFLSLVSVFMQFGALTVNYVPARSALFFILGLGIAGFLPILLVRSIEKSSVLRKALQILPDMDAACARIEASSTARIITIDLEPIVEAALPENEAHVKSLMTSLKLMLASSLKKEDSIRINSKKIKIAIVNDLIGDEKKLLEFYRDRIRHFIRLYNVPCMLESVPISVKHCAHDDREAAA